MAFRAFAVLLGVVVCAQALAGLHRYEHDDQILELNVQPGLSDVRRAELIAWIESAADALTLVYGRWPRDHWQVQVRQVDSSGSDPVPWAQVNRADPDRVSFYVDSDAGGERLRNDWTVYHELSHLLIPYRGWGDLWFSEGLASYYQNVLQVRHGVLGEREMWQRLHNGFVRGRTNRRPDLSLSALSPRMWENRSFMRVYWSGAWYFLAADLELRRRSGSEQSLDSALGQLNRCCADDALSARQIAARLDELTGQELFVPLFRKVASSRALPGFETLFADLGISIRSGRVELDDRHNGAAWRRGITGN